MVASISCEDCRASSHGARTTPPPFLTTVAAGWVLSGDHCGSDHEPAEHLDVLLQMAVTEEVAHHSCAAGRSEAGSELRVIEDAAKGCRERLEVPWVLDKESVAPVDDLVLNAAYLAGDDRSPLPRPR